MFAWHAHGYLWMLFHAKVNACAYMLLTVNAPFDGLFFLMHGHLRLVAQGCRRMARMAKIVSRAPSGAILEGIST